MCFVLWYFQSFSFLCDCGVPFPARGWAPVMKWVNDLEWAWWGSGGDWGEEKMTNIDLSWMFSCLVGAVPNTSLHPIPSHYLHALTAVQWVSYRVINTSSRPHTAPTSSFQTPPNDSRRQTNALLLLSPTTPFVNISRQPRTASQEKPAAARPPDFCI